MNKIVIKNPLEDIEKTRTEFRLQCSQILMEMSSDIADTIINNPEVTIYLLIFLISLTVQYTYIYVSIQLIASIKRWINQQKWQWQKFEINCI